MPNPDGTLKAQEVPMSDEEWEKNKNCDLKKRDHKYAWKNLGENRVSDTIGVCVHCGKETELRHK